MTVIQPKQIFDLLNIKDSEEAEKVLTETLDFLIYLRQGDVLETSYARFEKLSDDLIHIDTNIDSRKVLDDLEKKRIVKFPV